MGAEPLTVVTWNALGRDRPDLPDAARRLVALGADVLLVQEIQRRQLARLGTELTRRDGRRWHGCWRFKHWPVRCAAEGLGILTPAPVRAVSVQVLAHPLRVWDWRRRVAVHVAVRARGRLWRLVDVHLGAGVAAEVRIGQARALARAARAADVIAGDLNAAPRSRTLAVLADAGWRDAERLAHPGSPAPPTNWVPGPRTAAPTQRLDSVLVRPGVTVAEAFVVDDWRAWGALSDHVPVVARLAR